MRLHVDRMPASSTWGYAQLRHRLLPLVLGHRHLLAHLHGAGVDAEADGDDRRLRLGGVACSVEEGREGEGAVSGGRGGGGEGPRGGGGARRGGNAQPWRRPTWRAPRARGAPLALPDTGNISGFRGATRAAMAPGGMRAGARGRRARSNPVVSRRARVAPGRARAPRGGGKERYGRSGGSTHGKRRPCCGTAPAPCWSPPRPRRRA